MGEKPDDAFEYDVAISLRHGDLGIADEVKRAIDPPLTCFLYARNQEEIAGNDGLDKFRSVFRRDSRLNVVLYREGWGKTPWTGMEEVAIKDACLRTKYRNLLWVRLDSAAAPDWLPDTHQQFDLTTYSIPELAGVIKERSSQLGATLRAETGLERAKRIAEADAYAKATKKLLWTPEGVTAADANVQKVFDQIKRDCAHLGEANRDWNPQVKEQLNAGYLEVSLWPVRLLLLWRRSANTVEGHPLLARIQLPDDRDRIRPAWRDVFKEEAHVTRTPSLGYCWQLPPNGSAPVPSEVVADRWFDRFIDVRRTHPPRS